VGTGYVQVLSDSLSSNARSEAPLCNVYIESFDFMGYSEVSDWSGPMQANFTGQISAEQACDDVTAYFRLKQDDGTSYIATVTPALIKVDEYTWTFSTLI